MTAIKYRGGFKYQLATSVAIYAPELEGFKYKGSRFLQLVHDGDGPNGTGTYLLSKAGYAWDGPSGPMMDTKTAMVASLAHDGGAQISRRSPKWTELARDRFIEKNNDLFYRLCIESGMWRFRARYARWGVARVDAYADPKNKRKVYTAP